MSNMRLATESDIGIDGASSIANRAMRSERILQKAVHNVFMLGLPESLILKQLNEAFIVSHKRRAEYNARKAEETQDA